MEMLDLSPPKARVLASGDDIHISIINSGSLRYGFKVRCSNYKDYSFKPVHGFVKANTTTEIHVFRKSGKPGTDRILINFIGTTAHASQVSAEDLFRDRKYGDFSKEIQITAAESTESNMMPTTEDSS